MTTQLMDYRELNDYELLYMIRQKDESALNMLIRKYDKYLWAILNDKWNLQVPGFEIEDLMQVIRLKLVESTEFFNEEKGCSFITYLTMCVVRNISSIKRNVIREKMYIPYVLSLEGYIKDDAGNTYQDIVVNNHPLFDPTFYCEYRELLQLTKDFVSNLNQKDKKVWSTMAMNISYKDAAALLNIGEKTYDNAVYRIRKKFNQYLKQSKID